MCFERASVFNFDDVQSLEGALANLLSIVLFPIVWRKCLECCVQRAQQSRTREGKKALNFGFKCRPPARYIQYLDEGVDRSFASAFGEKFAFFCTNTSSER